MLALNEAHNWSENFWTQNLKIQIGKCNRIFFSYLKYYKLVTNVVFCCYYVIVETCAHQYMTAVIVLLYMQSSFSQNHEISNSWQTYIVKRQEKETEKLTKLLKKKTRPSSCQFSSPLPFFQQLILYCARHFFVQTTSGYYVFFLRPSKTKKIIHPWFLTLPVSRCITYNHTFNFTLWHIIFL